MDGVYYKSRPFNNLGPVPVDWVQAPVAFSESENGLLWRAEFGPACRQRVFPRLAGCGIDYDGPLSGRVNLKPAWHRSGELLV
jgi:hypothetical protein